MYSGSWNEYNFVLCSNFDASVISYPTSGAHRLCVLENSHDHAKLMGRPNKKVTTGVTEDDPPTVED